MSPMLFRMIFLFFFQITSFPVSLSFQTRSRFNFGFGIRKYAKYESMSHDSFMYRRASNQAEQSSEDDLLNRWTETKDRPLSGKERAAVELRNLKKSIADLGTKISSPMEGGDESRDPEHGASEPPLSTDESRQSTSLSNSISTLGSRLDTLTSKVSSRPVTAGTKDIIFSQGDASSSLLLSRSRQEKKSSEASVTPSSSKASTEKSPGISKPADSSYRVSTTSSYLDNLSATSSMRQSLVDGGLNASITEQAFNEYIYSSSSDPFSSMSKCISNGSNQKIIYQDSIKSTGSDSLENCSTLLINRYDQNCTDPRSDLTEYDTLSSDTVTRVDNMTSQLSGSISISAPYRANFVQSIRGSKKNASENTPGNAQRRNLTTALDNQSSTLSGTASELLDISSNVEEMGEGLQKVNNLDSDLENVSSGRKNDKDTVNSNTGKMRLLQTSYPTSISSTSSYLDSLSPRQSSKNKNASNISIQSVPDSVVGCLVLVIGFWISTQLLSFVWDILF